MVWSASLGERFRALWCLGTNLPEVVALEQVLYGQGDPAAVGSWLRDHPQEAASVWAMASRGLVLRHFGCWTQLLQDGDHWSAMFAPYGGLPKDLPFWWGTLTLALAQEGLYPWGDRNRAIGAEPWRRAIAHAWIYGDQPQLALGWKNGFSPQIASFVQLLIAAAYGFLPGMIVPLDPVRQSAAQAFWDQWVGGKQVSFQAAIVPPLASPNRLPNQSLISQGEYAWPADPVLDRG